jgi:hypothetical protein
MAPVTPGNLYEGYQLLGAAEAAPAVGIFIPLASMPDLSAAEADEATGDGRKVAFALTKEVFECVSALADNARPSKMTLARSIPTGLNNTTVRQGYTLNFDLDITGVDVSPEA